jgi:hypothetical protein
MRSVFLVQHVHVLASGEEDVKLIGVYTSLQAAVAAVDRLKIQPGFRDHATICDPMKDSSDDGFHISEYELDKDHWTEGFVPV